MSPKRFLLDTSALMTLIEDEDGADRVVEVLRQHQTFLPWMALLEVYYITQQERGQPEAERRYALLKELPAILLWDTPEPVLLTAARLKARHRISLADAIIAAFAQQNQATLLHKDPEYEALAPLIPMEHLPYKAPRV